LIHAGVSLNESGVNYRRKRGLSQNENAI
jgi:hypothetical protein